MQQDKSTFGFDDSHFKNRQIIIKDLKYIATFYIVIQTWQVINSLVTFIFAITHSDKHDLNCNVFFPSNKTLNVFPYVISRSCSYFFWLIPIYHMFKQPRHIKDKDFYLSKREKHEKDKLKKDIIASSGATSSRNSFDEDNNDHINPSHLDSTDPLLNDQSQQDSLELSEG